MLQLNIVVASTRPGRVGLPVAQWFRERAQAHGKFEIAFVDLKEAALPFLDEPHHPRLRRYQNAHTQAWSTSVASADAFVIVTPEYNFGMPPALLNAIDFVYQEWNYKPAAFVNYGGVSGGTRSAQMAKLSLTAVKVMPIPEQVTIPFVTQYLEKETGAFRGTEAHAKAAGEMLDELHRWAEALRSLRAAPG
jgi:NAD(P)H-dependent FMN reductase